MAEKKDREKDVAMATDIKDRVSAILLHFNGFPDELIPILQEIREQFGYLPAHALGEKHHEWHCVCTFYSEMKGRPR